MKKKLAGAALMLFLLMLAMPVWAADLKASDSQIRIWVRADGTLDVNEIHTYTIPPGTAELLRQFPDSDSFRARGFSAGEIIGGPGKIGEVAGEHVRALSAAQDGSEVRIGIPEGGGRHRLIYAYQLDGALSVYKEYSDLDVTFYSGWSREFEGLENLEVSVVFPENTGESSIRPFTRNMNGSDADIRPNGITFRDPLVEYPEEASYRVFFPSDVLTGAAKKPAPMSLEEAYREEADLFKRKADMKPYRDAFSLYGGMAGFIVLLLAAATLFIPQRVPVMISRRELILGTDPLYLHMIQRAGRFSPAVLDAAVMSLLEKGKVAAAGQGKAKTYRLLVQPDGLLPFEQALVEGFFKREPGGAWLLSPADAEAARRNRRLRDWQTSLVPLFEEAGTLNRRIPRFVLLTAAAVPAMAGVLGGIVSGKPVWWTLLFAAGLAVLLFFHSKKPERRWIAVPYVLYLLAGVVMYGFPDTGAVVIIALAAYLIVWLLFPRTVLRSLFANRLKYAINRFAWRPERRDFTGFSPKEVQLWENRSAVLRNKRLPGQ